MYGNERSRKSTYCSAGPSKVSPCVSVASLVYSVRSSAPSLRSTPREYSSASSRIASLASRVSSAALVSFMGLFPFGVEVFWTTRKQSFLDRNDLRGRSEGRRVGKERS